MALRVLLVGLVASMGFELPTGQDLSSWARSGRDWVDARAAELSGLRLEAEKALAAATDDGRGVDEVTPPTTEVASTRADLIFEAAVEGMASEFAVDLASMEEASPAEEAVVVVEEFREMPPAEEAVVVVEEFREMPPAEETATEPEPEGHAAEAPAMARAAEPAFTAEKLSAAVRLTRQAVNAWASLIQPGPVEVADDGRGRSF